MIPDEVWKRIEVSLKQYAGKDIYIAFKYTNSGGQNGHMWSVDDINVFNLSNHIDAEVVEITSPPSFGVNLTNAEPVTVKIKNNGGGNIGGFTLILECNGTVVATETYSGYINSLTSASYTFYKKVNLSASGNHTIKVTVVLEGDMNPNNDSKTKIVENSVLSVNEESDDFQRLAAWVEDGNLHVSRLNIGQFLEVYSVIGKAVYWGLIQSEDVSVALGTRGVYIVKSGSRVSKVVY
jgi:hypothetical protein